MTIYEESSVHTEDYLPTFAPIRLLMGLQQPLLQMFEKVYTMKQ